MVVCQYFLKGTCKFGNQCRNEHPSGGFGQTPTFAGLSKGSFQPSRGQNGNSSWGKFPSNANNGNQDSVEKTIQNIKQEVLVWEKSNTWPFSCFAHQKEKPCITGLMDHSPEELRLEAYKAKETGSINTYITAVQQLNTQWIARVKELSNLNAVRWEEEQKKMGISSGSSLFQTNPKGSGIFSTSSGLFSNQQAQTKPTGLFSSQTSGQSLFGQSSGKSLFGQSSGQPVFGGSSNVAKPASNPFAHTQSTFGGQMVKPVFGQNASTSQQGQGLFSQTAGQGLFGQQSSQQPKQGLFSQPANQKPGGLFSQSANQSSSGLFSKQPDTAGKSQGLFSSQPSQGLFGSSQPTQNNPFGQQQTPQVKQASSSLFGSNNQTVNPPQASSTSTQPGSSVVNPFLQAATQQSQQSDNTVPEVPSSLPVTEKDIAAFKADRFVFGQIPECPPPPELC